MKSPAYLTVSVLLSLVVPLPALGGEVSPGDGAAVFEPVREKSHVEKVRTSRSVYSIDVGGTVDMDNTTTRSYGIFNIAFQNNVSLTVANTGRSTVKNPRVITNGKRRWWCMEELLREILEGAANDQEKALLIWEFVRSHRHHDDPIFVDDELHDPVKMLNVFGAGLCDDSGYVGCSLLYHAGLNEKRFGKNPSERTLHGHMMCEAFLPSGYQFLDIDENTFYLDLENRRPVSGDAVVRDHYLAKREHAYGPIFKGWRIGESAASLFGRDDGSTFRAAAGHRIEFDLRPGEQIVYRWDHCGKFASDDTRSRRSRRFWGNSRWVYQPVLTQQRIDADAQQHTAGHLVYKMTTPYAVCGGRVEALFAGEQQTDRFSVSISLDGNRWKDVWAGSGKGPIECKVETDEALQYKRAPAKYVYFIKINSSLAALKSLKIETDLMTSPHGLPRLCVGQNKVEYTDDTPQPHEITITHRWRESDTIRPPEPPQQPIAPIEGETVRATTVPFRWALPAGRGAPGRTGDERTGWYHIRVSRRQDMRLPFRPCFDVMVESSEHHAPFAGLFSPDEQYYWRVRPCNRHGVWGRWSPVWKFKWQGPRIPVAPKHEIRDGRITISWQPNPGGERPVRYEVYGSDERGFTPSKTPYEVKGLGTRPGNLLCTTAALPGVTTTRLLVVSPEAVLPYTVLPYTEEPAMNRSFYRVVAIDGSGVASGPSDLLELPHPFIYSSPEKTATVGKTYRYQIKTLRCLGDLQFRYAKPNMAFWEKEGYEFELVEGPAWLKLDKGTGVLSGTPAKAGVHRITIACDRWFPDELKRGDHRPSYFRKDAARFQAQHRQTFELTVR